MSKIKLEDPFQEYEKEEDKKQENNLLMKELVERVGKLEDILSDYESKFTERDENLAVLNGNLKVVSDFCQSLKKQQDVSNNELIETIKKTNVANLADVDTRVSSIYASMKKMAQWLTNWEERVNLYESRMENFHIVRLPTIISDNANFIVRFLHKRYYWLLGGTFIAVFFAAALILSSMYDKGEAFLMKREAESQIDSLKKANAENEGIRDFYQWLNTDYQKYSGNYYNILMKAYEKEKKAREKK